ncbi:hypothetical protein F5Y05DRAFT_156208 [Hypoxylon sp. FL0543]|nr:hypothetical protein F5Y05DRAFT_156208 [Hypoxylon sp. FL0543]
MADEIRQTPVPVPVVYGQAPQQGPEAAAAAPIAGEAPAPTVEQPSSAEANAASTAPSPAPAPPTATAVAATTTMSNAPSPAAAAAAAPGSNAPPRTGTPFRSTTANGDKENGSSRAASQHPDAGFTMPAEAPPHGAPVRQYLNSRITGPLLDGMKMIAKDQPKDPLRVLGEYLIQRAKEQETSSSQ